MRNILFFIRRYANFILFLFLQGFSIYLITHYNTFHNAVGSAFMNEITGKVNDQYTSIDEYLKLKNTNQQLTRENERLRNELKSNFSSIDTGSKVVVDSIPYDTLGSRRKWTYFSAKVVANSVTTPNNFIVLSRGANEQLKKDEGVVDPNNGVVGIITDISDHYAVVMSLLHKDSKISAKLKNGGDAGQVIWDGKEPNRLVLTDIRKSAKVVKGDTVLTSGFTPTFPYGMLIGTIDEVVADKRTNNYIIKLKSSANFYNLQFVYAIDNAEKEEINKLIEKAKSRINN